MLSVALGDVEDETICAFCFITSAGVRSAQDTSSASDEAAAWTRGVGTTVVLVPLEHVVVLRRVKMALECSYVVKKAPAICQSCQLLVQIPVYSLSLVPCPLSLSLYLCVFFLVDQPE